MKKSKFLWGLVALLIMLLSLNAGCITIVSPTPTADSPGEQTEQPATTTAFSTYTDDVNGFSISYPQDWQRVPQDLLTNEELVAFWDFEEGEGFPPYMSVKDDSLSTEMDVDAYFALAKQAVEAQEGYSFISAEDTLVDNLPAIKHVFILNDGDLTSKVIQVYLVNGQRLWLINCMSVPEAFDSMEPIFQEIFDSFHLAGNTPPTEQPELPSEEAELPVFTTYSDEVNGFSFSYPEEWQLVPQDIMTTGDLIAVWDIVREDSFPPYVSIANEQLPTEVDIDDYSEASKQNVANVAGSGYAFISSDDLVINDIPAVKHVFTLDTSDANTKVIQVYLVDGQTGWVINCISSPESFDSLEQIFQNIINSFQLDTQS